MKRWFWPLIFLLVQNSSRCSGRHCTIWSYRVRREWHCLRHWSAIHVGCRERGVQRFPVQLLSRAHGRTKGKKSTLIGNYMICSKNFHFRIEWKIFTRAVTLNFAGHSMMVRCLVSTIHGLQNIHGVTEDEEYSTAEQLSIMSTCAICDVAFDTLAELKMHVMVMSPEWTFAYGQRNKIIHS